MSFPYNEGKKLCFFISPIGKEGTEAHKKFKEVFEYIVKPAIEKSSYKIEIIRADEINRSGSFLKDIIEYISTSYFVIADLTDQNPNVFYELGIRHALSNRTIIIAQSIDDVPSDLRSYRTIIYNTSAKEAAIFLQKINEIIKEIFENPERPDNPVTDYIPEIFDKKTMEYEKTINSLKEEITNILQGKKADIHKSNKNNIIKRVERIFSIKNAKKQIQYLDEETSFTKPNKDGIKESYKIPVIQGDFNLYYLLDNTNILDFWYISDYRKELNINELLADIRVLAEKCSKGQPFSCKIIICIDDDLDKEEIKNKFNKILEFIVITERKKFELIIWDRKGLEEKEKELGLLL